MNEPRWKSLTIVGLAFVSWVSLVFAACTIAEESLGREEKQKQKMPTVTLDVLDDERIVFDGVKSDLGRLKSFLDLKRAELEKLNTDPAQVTVLIRSAPSVKAGVIQQIVALCQKGGFEKFSLLALEFGPLKVRLTAHGDGSLKGILLGKTPVKHFKGLQQKIRDHFANEPALEVELSCDPKLLYSEVIRAIGALSNYRDADGKTVRLVEKISFAPRDEPKEP